MNKYKVNYMGFYYVEAETPEDAEDICDIDNIYAENEATYAWNKLVKEPKER